MAGSFGLKLGYDQALLLKKAIRVFSQVAYTDRELSYRLIVDNVIPTKVHLHFSPTELTLLCSHSHFRLAGMNTVLLVRPSSSASRYWCSTRSRTLCVSLHRLQSLLDLNVDDSIMLYGVDQVAEDILFQILDDDGMTIHSSTLPVIPLRDQNATDLHFLSCPYPMRVALNPESFQNIITQLESHGVKVHARASKSQVVFRAGNKEMVIEGGVCAIQSDEAVYPFSFNFDLHHKKAYLNAAILSDMVWFYKSADYTLLSFYIDGFAELVFTQL